jgi:hypothetical protein
VSTLTVVLLCDVDDRLVRMRMLEMDLSQDACCFVGDDAPSLVGIVNV